MRNIAIKPPLVLVGGGINALSVARHLAPQGITVYALHSTPEAVFASRFIHRIYIPMGLDPVEAWFKWMTSAEAEFLHGAVVLPCCDDGIMLIARHRDALENSYRLIEGNDDVLLAMLDKTETYRLAQRAGVPTPKSRPVRTLEDAVEAADWIGYPCALKPRHGHIFRRVFDAKLFVVKDCDELKRFFDLAQQQESEMLLTEIIPGPENLYRSCFTYLDKQFNPLFLLTKRKSRQFPLGFGLGTHHTSDQYPDPEVAEMGLRFMRGVGLTGYGSVEFKRDPRDGQLKLMECNARFVLIHEMLELSGIPASLLVYNRLADLPLPHESNRRSVNILLPLSDLKACIQLHRRGELTAKEWLISMARPQHFLIFRWNDPGPWLALVYHYWIIKVRKLRYALLRCGRKKWIGQVNAKNINKRAS